MAILLKNVSIHGILLDVLFEAGNREWEIVYDLIQDGIQSGVVKPLNSTIFGHMEAENAFRYLAQGKHIGKVLIKVKVFILIITYILLLSCDSLNILAKVH